MDLTAIRHDFHAHPELGFKEVRTKARVAEILRQLGIEVHEGAGVVGILKAGTGKRAIGLRADMDALPIQERSVHEYVSKTLGVMHACGHDGHTTMLLGAAQLLAHSLDFDGTVVLIFQPNEEHGFGAQAMIDEGVLEQFPIEEIYGIHNLPGTPTGHVSTRVGQICASESLFEITITGQGGHASMPHVGVDAITVGAELVMALQTIVARKMPPDSGAVVSVTEFLTDGQRNVLPGTAMLKGDVRARQPADRLNIKHLLKQISDGVAAAHGVTITNKFDTAFVETINASIPTQAVVRAASEAGLQIDGDRTPLSFSEDFGVFSNHVPGCFLLIGNGTEGPHSQPLHANDYDFNDALLTIGTNFWCSLVRDRLALRK